MVDGGAMATHMTALAPGRVPYTDAEIAKPRPTSRARPRWAPGRYLQGMGLAPPTTSRQDRGCRPAVAAPAAN